MSPQKKKKKDGVEGQLASAKVTENTEQLKIAGIGSVD